MYVKKQIRDLAGQAPVTGFSSATGTIVEGDSIVTAISKVDGNMADKADLVSGKVPAAQLPGYVDDVLEFADFASFPGAGESGKIYVAIDTVPNLSYRWSGSAYIAIGGGGSVNWGTLLGDIEDQDDLMDLLDAKLEGNAPITGATKTKVTYDADGLITAGADATTGDIADSTDKRYVTDADLVKLGNTSGTNTGDQDLSGLLAANTPITGATKTKITYDADGLVTGGADATTADIADSSDKRYVTDAEKTKLSNTSGSNTGDQILSFADAASFPGTGTAAKLYYAVDVDDYFKWNGTTYELFGAGGGGGGGTWGSITGTLSSQTDLQSALDNKADDVLSAGYLAAPGTVAIGDSIEEAIEKIVGNVATNTTTLGTLNAGNNLFNYYNFR